MAKLFFLLTVFLPSILGKCDVDKAQGSFHRSIYDFSMELNSRIAVDKDFHYVTSPLSVWSVISAASLGADGITLEEIQKVLKHHKNRCLNQKYYVIVQRLIGSNADVTVEKSGAIVVDKELNVKNSFVHKIQRSGISTVMKIPFDDLEQVAGEVNSFISNATHGRIEELVSADELVDKLLVLLDVIYFKGNWKVPFVAKETEIAPFYSEDGQVLGDVNLMFVNKKFSYISMDLISAKVLELPYGNGRFSMLLFLPYEGTRLMTVMDLLKNISLRSIYSLFESNRAMDIMVQLPRFKIDTDLDNLEELLKDMGLESMFDTTARFPGISDTQLHVGGIKQKASIEVNENGTVAIGATEIDFQDRSLPPQIDFQRPFLFMIVEKQSEVVLFTGAYSKPSLF